MAVGARGVGGGVARAGVVVGAREADARGPAVGSCEVDEVGEGVADGGHFPVEDADDAGFGLVEDEVVDFVVAVDQGGAVAGLAGFVAEEGDHVIEVGDRPDGLFGLDIDGGGLVRGQGGEGFDLAVVEVGRFSE